MRTPKRDAALMALLAVSFAALAVTAVRVFHRPPARADGVVVAPTPEAAASGPRSTASTPAARASAAAAPEARRTLRTDTLAIDDVPKPGARPSPAHAAVDEPMPTPARRSGTSGFASAASPPSSSDSYAEIASPRAGVASPTSSAPRPASSSSAERAPVPGGGSGAANGRASTIGDELGVTGVAGGIVTQARQFKVSGGQARADDLPDLSNPANVRAAFLEQQAVDERVGHSVREALGKLGPDADIEDQRKATADALAAAGQPHDEISITNALAHAQEPPPGSPDAPTPPAPGALDSAIDSLAATFSPTSGASAANGDTGPRIPVGPEYIPPEKPPRGVRDAYKNYASAFATALKNFGVEPWDILAIAQQETSFGRNMGHVPLPQGLARRRADLAAAIQLDANKQLPAPWQNLRGSETGAMGPFQFEPATQLRAGRGNPFDWNNQIAYSVPHLLKLNGYKANDPIARRKAFGRYYGDGNPNGKYALSVAGHAAAIKPVIENSAGAQ